MSKTDLDYDQILYFSDIYLVNEIYKRLDDDAYDVYKRIQEEHQ